MRRIWQRVESWVISDATLPLEQQCFQVLSLLGGVLSLIVILPVNQFQHLNPWVDRVVLVFGLVCLGLARAARRGRYYKKTLLLAIILCLDLVWFPNGGSTGSIGLYFFSAALFLVLFFQGRARLVLLAALLANVLGLHLLELARPELAHAFRNPHARLLDLTTGYVLSIVICALMLGVILAGSHRERRRLAESERMYRELLERQGEGFMVVDDQECILVVNRVAEEIFGAGLGQLQGRCVTEFLPEDQQELVRRETRRRSQGLQSTYEVQIRRMDGELRTLQITATPWNPQRVEGVQSIGVFRDITEQKAAEARVRESEAKFRAFVEESLDVIFMLDPEGTFLFVSPAWEHHFGYSTGEVTGRPFAPFVHPEDLQPCIDYLGEVLATGQRATSPNYRVRHADGTWRWFSANGTRVVTAEGEARFLGVGRDITAGLAAQEELQRRDEALRRQNDLFTSLLSILPVGVLMVEAPSGRPMVVNETARRLLGRSELPDLSARNLVEVYRPYRVETLEPYPLEDMPIILGMRGQSSHVEDMMVDRPDGSSVLLEVFGTPVLDAQGQVRASLTSLFDISARRQAAEEKASLEAKNHRLRKAESLGRMAGSIAHHFNNSLQSVMSNLELMSMLPEGADPATQLSRARLATEKAAEMSRLLRVYLGQSIETGEPHHLSELCRDSLPALVGTLPGTVTLETDLPTPGPVVQVHAGHLQQVIQNLLVNASESLGEAGGSLGIRVETCQAEDISPRHRFPVDWQPQGPGYACLEVRDTGCGIAEADMERLFDPFFSTKFSGRGLGLPVLLGIVQAHGGAVVVESRVGRGSAFRVYLPLSSEAALTHREPVAQVLGAQGSGTILLVDDDEALLASTGALIEMMGFDLLTARDGLEAVEVFQAHAADIRCVITDLTMPRMDGWETLAALRRLQPSLPVIMASGYDKGQMQATLHEERPQVFLEKPFGLQDLCQAVGQALLLEDATEG